jgi:hypothetical protein
MHGCPASMGSLVQAGHAWVCASQMNGEIVDTGFVCQDYTIFVRCVRKVSQEARKIQCLGALHIQNLQDGYENLF